MPRQGAVTVSPMPRRSLLSPADARNPGRAVLEPTVMHGVDVAHEVAVLALAFTVIRGVQAIVEHYFPTSEPAAVARFLFGGP